MSLRRKSCNSCFKSRRKCDLSYPTCETCRSTRKTCQYAYVPVTPTRRTGNSTPSDAAGRAVTTPALTNTSLVTSSETHNGEIPVSFEVGDFTNFLFDDFEPATDLLSISNAGWSVFDHQQPSVTLTDAPATPPFVHKFVGNLGELMPIQGSTQSFQWVMDQLREYPREFALQAHTLFVHRQLYRDSTPKPIRAAFGLSSAVSMLNDSNRAMLFRAVDDEVLDLLKPMDSPTLLDDLARLQSFVIYQIIRLFHGSMEQRAVAEQQQVLLMTWALKLVSRSEAELRVSEAQDWHAWILAESTRRTAMVVYMLYGVYSIFREGICVGFPTLAKLPVSAALSCWDSEVEHRHHSETGETVPYEIFTERWLVSTPKSLDEFEKFLLIPCKGIDIVSKYSNRETLAL
jgi:hypothetical protein